MNQTDLKQIDQVLSKRLKLELAPIKKTQTEHSERLDSLTLDMINVQKRVDILPDMFDYIKNNKEKIDELEQRVESLEAA